VLGVPDKFLGEELWQSSSPKRHELAGGGEGRLQGQISHQKIRATAIHRRPSHDGSGKERVRAARAAPSKS